MSRPRAHQPELRGISGYETSVVRCAVAIGLALLGVAWLVVYYLVARDHAVWVKGVGKEPSDPLPWMSKLENWNYLIGFGLFFLGLVVSANKTTPAGRGQGVVIGMLGCFLVGLVWVVVYYFAGIDTKIPVMNDLDQKNLFLGVAFMAVGFSFATKWE